MHPPRIFAKWMRCYTQEEIAEEEGVGQQTVANILAKFTDFSNIAESGKVLASHNEPDFKRPLYNVWKWQEKTEGVRHPTPLVRQATSPQICHGSAHW